ncbi:MAG: hypothetical protein J0I06_00385 [Planctomycetes bacterium]|nr:hypothetical protein [Planctomycetota bacterium]
MQLIAPDILAEARGLTGAMTGTICVLGFALWLFGWRWHRFWIVAGITLASGLIGLNAGRTTNGTQVMAVGILLAVSAGLLALELAKVLAFVAGGCGAWLAVQWVLPQAQELWAVFLSGGLFGLLLYRLWTMLLTSLIGALLACHAGLLLAEPFFYFDAVAWAGRNIPALNGVVVGMAVLGILLQAVSAPDEGANDEKPKEEKTDQPDDDHGHGGGHGDDHGDSHDHAPPAKPAKTPWWKKLIPTRKAA